MKLLNSIITKIFPVPDKFESLKNKYKTQIDKFFQDFTDNKIPYVKYINEYKNFKSEVEKVTNKFDAFGHVIIAGIGGIVNGTKAIYNALNIQNEFVFIDNLSYKIFLTLEKYQKHFNPEKDILILVSKSGNTLETLIESSYSIGILPGFLETKNVIVMTSEEEGALYKMAKKFNLNLFILPSGLGGRFSHFYSAMIPLALCKIDYEKIFKGAASFIEKIENNFFESKFLYFALNLYNTINQHNISNVVLLNYIDRFDALMNFFVQLWDESLGKRNEKGIRFGASMINALCPKEQHSQLQAFLEGRHDKMFMFFVPSKKFTPFEFEDKLFFNRKFNLTEILNAQGMAVLESFINEKLPVVWFEINDVNEEFIGEILTFFSILVILGGYINNSNPYNQDAVELYKKLTRVNLKLEESKGSAYSLSNLFEL